MSLLKVADLFCGAGGAAMGVHNACEKAGVPHRIVGFDIKPMPHYPFEFVQQDAMTVDLAPFDAVWASPPCQWGIWASSRWRHDGREYPEMVNATRLMLSGASKPYVMEQPARKALINPLKLCGTAFPELAVVRHRYFEVGPDYLCLQSIPYQCRNSVKDGKCFTVVGHGGNSRSYTKDAWSRAMGIDWMTKAELTQAIPPVYAEFIWGQLLRYLNVPAL